MHPSYRLKLKYLVSLPCQVFSTCYTAVQIKNCLKNTSVIKASTMKNMDDFLYAKEAITYNHTFHCK